jgi:hypothetical protein
MKLACYWIISANKMITCYITRAWYAFKLAENKPIIKPIFHENKKISNAIGIYDGHAPVCNILRC